jgi:hypothetical protein
MRLPSAITALVALCLAAITATGVPGVRSGAAAREHDRAVRMTRGPQRLDFSDALLHAHEELPVAGDHSSEPAVRRAVEKPTGFVAGDSSGGGALVTPVFRERVPVMHVAGVRLRPEPTLVSTATPPSPGRAPPSC